MQEDKEQQQFFLQYALALGEQGRLFSPPNPWVGCVIVREGKIVGEGYHTGPGKPHAEVVALENAGEKARGAVAYVSLEPCAHYGRTPPCVQALVEAGITRVVFPFLDPDPAVAGKGYRALKEKGIAVEMGICEEQARRCLEPYLWHREKKRPFCLLKTATTLDGHIATAQGRSQWITGEQARIDAHRLRAYSQAVLIGNKTALHDLPSLTARGVEISQQPLRVLLDSSGSVPAEGPLFDKSLAPTLIFTTNNASPTRRKQWEKAGAEVVEVAPEGRGVCLEEVLKILGERAVLQLLVEGGSLVQASFYQKKYANLWIFYVGACLLGVEGKPFFPLVLPPDLHKIPRFSLEKACRLGDDMRLDYRMGWA